MDVNTKNTNHNWITGIISISVIQDNIIQILVSIPVIHCVQSFYS